jgi:uncharacterized repeat protein (TIGR01451 family)
MNVFRRLALSAIVSAAVGVPVAGQAQSCPTPPGKDVLLFVDNSSSITNAEFDEAQQAIAGIAASVLSRPGYRLAVVNWGCEGGRRTTRDGCRVDLATGSAIPGGWSSNPADFAYAGNNSASNRVCRSFGTNFAGSINRNNCGGANFSVNINDDYAQHGLKILEGVLYSGGTTGGNDSYNQPTLGPSTPTQQLMLIHMTDADPNFGRFDGTSIREMPSTETGLGFYHYSNRFKNVRNAVIVGVGIDAAAANAVNRGEVAAFASRGGAATDYDSAHPTALSTQAFDTGTPRIASYSTAYNDATILSAANTAFNATVPACVIVRKQSVGDTGSFSFTGGTNGLPSTLTLDTTTANPRAATGVFLSQFNTDTGIREVIPSGYTLSSIGCTNAGGTTVPVTANTTTGQLTIPGSQIVAGAQLTCTFTNTRIQPDFGTCDARMFMDQTSTNTSTLFDVNYATAPFTLTSLGSSTTTTGRNGVGYNALDNYMYGIRSPASGSIVELIRVGSNGTGQNLGAIAGLPGETLWNNGVISPTGDYYLKSGLSNTTLYRVNLATLPYTATAITLSQPVRSYDFAWHDGLLYGVDSTSSPSRLVSINPVSGAVTTIGASTFPLSHALAMWGYNNMLLGSEGVAIYALDPATGAVTRLSGISPATNNGDGANCPTANIQFNADLSATKTNTPTSGPNDEAGDTYVPGEVRTYQVVVTNAGPFGAQNITVSDPVPAGINASTVSWTCASTSGGAVCGAASGTGALNDTGLDLPPSAVATYLVTMTVPAGFTGDLTNTVTITPPSTINDTNPANNTATDVDQANNPQPSFGTCPADAFITRGATATTVRLYTLGLADGAMTDQGTSPALADMVNGIGFRQQDGYIWGWGNGATVRRLVRIGVGGVADVPYATAPAGLPAAPQFYSADVSPAGIYTGVIDNQLWFINVATNTLAGPPVTLASSDIGTDIAYHPTDGNLYTVRSSSGEVVRINPATGAVTPIGISLPNAAPGGFGGVFFDNQGTLYAYKSNSPGGTGLVYRVFNVDGSGTLAYDLLSTSLTAASLDGARCPVAPPQGAPAIILRKTTTGGFSGPFAFAINNTVDTSGTATTTAAGTPVQVDGDDSTPGVQPFTVETAALGRSLTINEANLPTGWRLTGATCRVDGTAVGSLTDTTYTIPGASVVTGALFECDFTNALRQTDIQVVKTASPNPVVSSDVVTYQIVVTNNGPLAADGAVLTDVAGVGQDCATPSTTATCSATGGATCPSPTVPVSSLLGSGITIPTLPVGGQVTIGLQCTVSATGTP